MMLCHWASGSWHFKGTWCLRLQGQRIVKNSDTGKVGLGKREGK